MYEYKIKLVGDLSGIEGDVKKKLGDIAKEVKNNSITVQFDYDMDFKDLQSRFDEFEKMAPEIGLKFRYDFNLKYLEAQKDKLSEMELTVDTDRLSESFKAMYAQITELEQKSVAGLSGAENKAFETLKISAAQIAKTIEKISEEAFNSLQDDEDSGLAYFLDDYEDIYDKVKPLQIFDTKEIEAQRAIIKSVEKAIDELIAKGADKIGIGNGLDQIPDKKVVQIEVDTTSALEAIDSLDQHLDELTSKKRTINIGFNSVALQPLDTDSQGNPILIYKGNGAPGTSHAYRSSQYAGNYYTTAYNTARDYKKDDDKMWAAFVKAGAKVLEIDARGSGWTHVTDDRGITKSTDAWADYAKKYGYDLLKVKNVLDSGYHGLAEIGDDYVVINEDILVGLHNVDEVVTEIDGVLRNALRSLGYSDEIISRMRLGSDSTGGNIDLINHVLSGEASRNGERKHGPKSNSVEYISDLTGEVFNNVKDFAESLFHDLQSVDPDFGAKLGDAVANVASVLDQIVSNDELQSVFNTNKAAIETMIDDIDALWKTYSGQKHAGNIDAMEESAKQLWEYIDAVKARIQPNMIMDENGLLSPNFNPKNVKQDIESDLAGKPIEVSIEPKNSDATDFSPVDYDSIKTQAHAKMYEAGLSGADGYIEAFRSSEKRAELETAVSMFVESGIEAAKTAQDSHSPSEKYKQLGQDAMEGYIQGVRSKQADVEKAVSDVITAGYEAGKQASEQTLPFNVNVAPISGPTPIIAGAPQSEPSIKDQTRSLIDDLKYRVANSTKYLNQNISNRLGNLEIKFLNAKTNEDFENLRREIEGINEALEKTPETSMILDLFNRFNALRMNSPSNSSFAQELNQIEKAIDGIGGSYDLTKVIEQLDMLDRKKKLFGELDKAQQSISTLFGKDNQDQLNSRASSLISLLEQAKSVEDFTAVSALLQELNSDISSVPKASEIKKISTSLNDMRKLNVNPDFVAALNKIEASLSGIKSQSDVANILKEIGKAKLEIPGYKKAAETLDKLAQYRKSLTTMQNSGNYTAEGEDRIKELLGTIDKIRSIDNIDLVDPANIKMLNDLESKMLDFRQNIRDFKIGNITKLFKNMQEIAEILQKNTKMSADLRGRFQQLSDEMQTLGDSGQFSTNEVTELTNRLVALKTEMNATGQTGKGAFDIIGKRLMGLNAQFIAQYFSIQDWIRYFRQAAQTVIELDTALTELRKVSDASTTRLQQSFRASAATAKELGATVSDVINITADWSRLGETIDNAENLARVTTLFKNVGDNISAEDASSYMITAMKGFKIAADDAEHIVDVYNEVANNFAIDRKMSAVVVTQRAIDDYIGQSMAA